VASVNEEISSRFLVPRNDKEKSLQKWIFILTEDTNNGASSCLVIVYPASSAMRNF